MLDFRYELLYNNYVNCICSLYFLKGGIIMPSLGAHLAITWMICQDSNRDLSTPMVVGSFIPDILGCFKASHFRGESGCIYPDYKVLGTSCIPVSCWDNNPSNVELNPQIHLREFFSHNRFSHPDFALGIRSHIVADAMWTGTLPKVFDFSEQDKGIVRNVRTGAVMSPLDYKDSLYKFYPELDNYLYKMARITERDLQMIKKIICEELPSEKANFICQYLNYRSDYTFASSGFDEEILESYIAKCLAMF